MRSLKNDHMVTRMGGTILWLYSIHELGIMSFIGVCVLASIINSCQKSLGDRTKSDKARQARLNAEFIQEKEMKKQAEDLRERIANWQPKERAHDGAFGVSTPAPAKVVRLDPKSIKVLRNTLMKHHEMKATDRSYQESEMCKDTNNIIQQLNDIIATHT